MVEIFLFVNPLGEECYHSGKTIINFSENDNKNIKVRLIPYVNFKIVGNQLDKSTGSKKSLEARNELFNQCYITSLAFQAALMQGKKKGIKFFLALQNRIFEDNQELTNGLIKQIADEVKLDKDMFLEDWESDLVKQTFSKDQKLAHEMSVSDTPSCIIYNYSKGMNGYRIDSQISDEILETFCEVKTEEYATPDLLNTNFQQL